MAITGSNFVGNTAMTSGGCIHVKGATLVVEGSSFIKNIAQSGGAISTESSSSLATFSSSVFEHNNAKSIFLCHTSGAPFCSGDPIGSRAECLAKSTLETPYLCDSCYGEGGAIHMRSGSMIQLTRSSVVDNCADVTTGGVYMDGSEGSRLRVHQSMITGNIPGNVLGSQVEYTCEPRFAIYRNFSQCRPCGAGEVSDQGFCFSCPAGRYQHINQCAVCSANTFQSEVGQTRCSKCAGCPIGSRTGCAGASGG